jgi:hypothetical protein
MDAYGTIVAQTAQKCKRMHPTNQSFCDKISKTPCIFVKSVV